MKRDQALINLVVASLISEGYPAYSRRNSKNELCVPFQKEKSYYLRNYLKSFELGTFVDVEIRKEEMRIVLNDGLYQLVNQWYEGNAKVFNTKIATEYLNNHAVILCINLFGTRKVEGIGIPTSISKSYLRTVSFSLEKILNLNVVIGNNQLKIIQVAELFLESYKNFSSIDCTEIANFLTQTEKNKLRNAILKKGGELYE